MTNDLEKPQLFSPGAGKMGMTQLHFDAYCGDLKGIVRCLENGMDVNASDNYRGYTPILWLADMAATGGPRVEILRILVQNGGNVDAISHDRKTALMLAREAGSAGGDDLATELVALGAKES